MSESAFVIPAVSRSAVVRLLDELAVAGHGGWSTDTRLSIWLMEEASGLYQDWEPEDIANLEQAVGRRPEWAVQIDYRLSRRADLAALTSALLKDGGVAVDDFCSHVWTAAEIETDTVISGGRFGGGPVR
ncbi:hypothetical protein [Micromonospora sp. NPDC000442]|uniref:hypothetical protein n=1 Tax=Micromonospora sp. NPDC000442 TaxID=3364217 RepID=UPI0036CAE9C3